jgi:hypothetical protein
MSAPRASTSSASSAESKASQLTSYGKKHQCASFCYKKDTPKWYDCLRPSPTMYQGFGGLATNDFSEMSGNPLKAGEEECWTEEIRHVMPTAYADKKVGGGKNKKASR